jgi:hypothetical protein
MPHVITLIHGTFAKSAAWCRPDSPLCNSISSAFGDDVIFAPFVWSGRNAFRDRKQGADSLLQHFRDLRTKYPDSKHLAIAHSHGGNILVNTLQRSPESVVNGYRSSGRSIVLKETGWLCACNGYPAGTQASAERTRQETQVNE